MKIIYSVLLTLILGTSGNAQDVPDAEWTVMVFLNADNNLEPFGLQDFNEMARVDDSSRVNIVVQMDRVPGFAQEPGAWNQTLRYKMRRGIRPIVADAVQDLGEVNMGDGSALTNFVTWAVEGYPAKRYALVIWDHGQGWRFRQAVSAQSLLADSLKKRDRYSSWIKQRQAFTTERQTLLPADIALREVLELPEDSVFPGAVRYVSSDDSSNDHLFNREIQDSLGGILPELVPGGKLDVIAFDACLMQMVETAYALRNTAKVLAASEELEPGAGWNYKIALGGLIANPGVDAEAFGKHLVEAYRQTYENSDDTTTYSALRLNELEKLAQEVSTLAQQSNPLLTSDSSPFRAARDMCWAFAPGYGMHGIDLDSFCLRLYDHDQTPESLKPQIQRVRDQVAAATIATFAAADRNDSTPYGARGVAIYFPQTESQYLADPDRDGYSQANTDYPVEFVETKLWDEFLHQYFRFNP